MPETAYYDEAGCDLETFLTLLDQSIPQADLPFAQSIDRAVPNYDMAVLAEVLADPASRRALMAEWAGVLARSSGVLVLKNAYPDTLRIDAASAVFNRIIAHEAMTGDAKGDHFATAGANARIWNALQKLCEADPEVFALYFGNDAIAAVAEAWLGPGYQMTAQVNLVRPGVQAQTVHRDYHLGFQSAVAAARFPAHVHDLSPVLTLQGAIAHCDMPVESGPTKLLPFSQLYRPGYMAYRRADFLAAFESRCIQLPLAKGDAIFFNPALFHAAGENRSADIQRMANLLQISSPFGRAMEAVDRSAMCRRVYPAIQVLQGSGRLAASETRATIAACAEGYAFPTNLDCDPPLGGLAPETQAALMARALTGKWTPQEFKTALDAQDTRRQA